jgi:hypothetical protein
VVEKGLCGVHIGEVAEVGCFEGLGALVEIARVADLAGGDECERAVNFCGDPGRVLPSQQGIAVIKPRKDLRVGGAGVEQTKILREFLFGIGEVVLVALKNREVSAYLLINVLARLVGLVAVVEVLNGLFEADGDD